MKLKKRVLFVLILSLVLSLFPAAALAGNIELYGIEKVLLQTYPGSAGNDLPIVGQDISTFTAQTTTPGVVVTGWSLVDDNGVQCTGKVQERMYTMSVNISSVVVNSVFTSGTKAYINNEPADITVSSDGMSATASRYIMHRLIAPTVWKDPGDESHNAGETFSYVASASPYYDTVEWYVLSPYNESTRVEEIGNVFPDVTASVHDHGASGSTMNLNRVPGAMNEWMVYCIFKGAGGQAKSKNAMINVLNAEPAVVMIEPSPTPVPTPTITAAPVITIVETPEPTMDIWVVEEDWSDEWTYDNTSHWHASRIPGVTDVNSKGEHTLIWTETKPATKKEDGERQGVCSVCGYTETQPVVYVKPQRTSINLPSSVKWIIGIVVGILVLAALVLFIQYRKDRARRRRRARMSGRNRTGRH